MLLIDIWANIAAHGPVCGVNPRKTDRVLHAIDAEAVLGRFGDKRTTVDAPCGERVRIISGEIGPFMWPPRVSMLPAGTTRCVECHLATGRKRPHSAWAAANPGDTEREEA